MSNGDFPCNQCSKSFKSKQALAVHVTRAHKKKTPVDPKSIRVVPGRGAYKKRKKKDDNK